MNKYKLINVSEVDEDKENFGFSAQKLDDDTIVYNFENCKFITTDDEQIELEADVIILEKQDENFVVMKKDDDRHNQIVQDAKELLAEFIQDITEMIASEYNLEIADEKV